jgi:hypothetical protein
MIDMEIKGIDFMMECKINFCIKWLLPCAIASLISQVFLHEMFGNYPNKQRHAKSIVEKSPDRADEFVLNVLIGGVY